MDADAVLRFDVYELDTRVGELRKRGVKQRLQGQPLQVLATLLRRAGDLVTREELRTEIWAADIFVDFDHSLHNAVARIREALGDSAEKPRFVETLPRRGYRFIERVDAVGLQATPAFPVQREQFKKSAIRALAVLPLTDLSGDPGNEYFADGMTEALITSLAKIKALRVISRTSAMQYKGARKSLPRIARELNVDAVIEGSVLRSGERVRITAQLIQATTDQHLWAESYERDFRDILALQSEIARQVASEVKVIVSPEEKERLGSARRVDPETHELYLKARYYWNKRTEESVHKALSYFHRVIDNTPAYAPGYSGMADAYNILGFYNALPPREAYPEAKAAALKALELDRSLGESHAALGVVKRDFEWDWAGAESEFGRAIELNPGYVEAYHWRGTLFSMMERHAEAVQEKKRALAMDPLSVVIRADLGRMFYYAGEYDQALGELRASLEMDPNFGAGHLWLGYVYQQNGEFESAILELESGVRLSAGSTYALAKLGHGYASAGRRDEAAAILKLLDAVAHEKYVSPYDVAMIYFGLQENDAGFAWLEKAFEQRSLWMGYLNVEPQLNTVRSDARFQNFLGRVGLRG